MSTGTPLGDGKVARLRYYQFSVLFFSVCFRETWEVVGRDRAQDRLTTKSAIEDEYDVELFGPSWWDRLSLIVLVAAIGLFLLIV